MDEKQLGVHYNHRHDMRVAVDIPVKVQEHEGPLYHAKVLDISLRGIGLLSDVPIDSRTWANLQFVLNGFDVDIDCKIVNCKRIKHKGHFKFRLGCVFQVTANPKEKAKIQQIIKGQQKQDPFWKKLTSFFK